MSLRIRRLLVLPIDGELPGIKPRFLLCLPLLVLPPWTKPINPKVLLTIHQAFHVEEAGIDDVSLGSDTLLLEALMDLGRHRPVRGRPHAGLHVAHQPGTILVTGLAQVRFVANPGGGALLGEMGIEIVGVTDKAGGGRDPLLISAPVERAILDVLRPDADTAQDLDGGDLPVPKQALRGHR